MSPAANASRRAIFEGGGMPIQTIQRRSQRTTLAGLWRRCLIAGAITAGLALAGCGGSGASAPASSVTHAQSGSAAHAQSGSGAGQQVTITGTSSLRFTPMMVHVHTGKVRIILTDMGAYPHNLVIPALGVTSATVTGDPGGMRVSFTVTFAHVGRYAFHCQYHASAGMTGVFVVS
jgi:plastocyanin